MDTEAGTIGMLIAAVGALSGALTWMAKFVLNKVLADQDKVEKREALTQKKLDDCEHDRSKLWQAIADHHRDGTSGPELRERYEKDDPE